MNNFNSIDLSVGRLIFAHQIMKKVGLYREIKVNQNGEVINVTRKETTITCICFIRSRKFDCSYAKCYFSTLP